jgi:endonuclease-3
MATVTNKQRVLTQLFAALKKSGVSTEAEARPVLEQLIYGICREDTSRELADQAYENLRSQFFDWNEIRVSSSHEVLEALSELPNPEQRAERIISLLQEVFEATFSFDLESMHKKGVKQAVKSLGRYQAINDYTTAWVVQQTLGGHAVPIDPTSLRVITRLGLIDREQDDPEVIRTTLEHLVPKAKGSAFTDLVSWVGNEYCAEDEPSCSSCPLASECPASQEFAAAEMAAARSTRSKPR